MRLEMSNPPLPEQQRISPQLKIGSVISFIILALVLSHLISQVSGETRPWAPWNQTYADFGQWLSGVAGALAFVWIVVSYTKQSAAYNEQASEMKRMREEADRRAASEYQHRNLLERDVLIKTSAIIRDQQHHLCQLLIERLRRQYGNTLRILYKGIHLERQLPSQQTSSNFGALEFLLAVTETDKQERDQRDLWCEFVFRGARGLVAEAQAFVNAQAELQDLATKAGMSPYFSYGPFADLAMALNQLDYQPGPV